MATHPGMVDFELENFDTQKIVSYECNDLQCAQMLAAEDHGGEPEDWLHVGSEEWRETKEDAM